VIVVAQNLFFVMRPNFFLNETKERTDFYYVNRILSQVHNPKIMYSFLDIGYGTPSHALPACKYWTRQVGATEKMLSERESALKQQIPDFFIYVWPNDNDSIYFANLLQESGYIKYHTWTVQQSKWLLEAHLYGRPGFSLPPKDFHISPIDVLLKRRIFPPPSVF
jgi:hypothetical protein